MFSLVRVTVKHNNTCLVLLRNAKINPLESSRHFRWFFSLQKKKNSLFFLPIHPFFFFCCYSKQVGQSSGSEAQRNKVMPWRPTISKRIADITNVCFASITAVPLTKLENKSKVLIHLASGISFPYSHMWRNLVWESCGNVSQFTSKLRQTIMIDYFSTWCFHYKLLLEGFIFFPH